MLSKLIVNQFVNLNFLELKFDKFTSINGKGRSIKALESLTEAFKFVLECSELSLKDQLKLKTQGNTFLDATFVEAHVCSSSGPTIRFRKSIVNQDVLFEIDGNPTSQQEYKNALIQSQIVLAKQSSLILDKQSIDKVSSLTDKKRATFIELLSTTEADDKSYEMLSNQIEKIRVELDVSVKQQNELTNEKKRLRKEIESVFQQSKLKKDVKKRENQLDLFKIFHNKNFLESVYKEIEELTANFAESREKVLKKLESVTEAAEQEIQMRNKIYIDDVKLSKDIGEFHRNQDEFFKLQAKANLKSWYRNDNYYTIEKNKEKIHKIFGEVQKLQQYVSNKNRFEEVHAEYVQLKRAFEEENKDELVDLSMMQTICEDDHRAHLKKRLKSHKAKIFHNAQITEQVTKLKEKQDFKKLTLNEFEKRERVLNSTAKDLQVLMQEIVDANEKKRKVLSNNNEKTIEDLKEKFKEKVYGRLSDFWTPVGKEYEKLLTSRLDKFANSIVVDDRSTAEACIEILKVKHISSVGESFLILSELVNQKTSKNLIPCKTLPKDCVFIETLVNASLAEMEKAILFCMKPSLVLNETEEILKWSGSRKLNILSNDTGVSFETEGFIRSVGNINQLLEHEICQADEKMFGMSQQIRKLNFETLKQRIEEIFLKKEIFELDLEINQLELTSNNIVESEFAMAEIENEISDYKWDDTKFKQTLSDVRSKIKHKEENHFRTFCSNLSVESIEEYLKQRIKVTMGKMSDMEEKIVILNEEISQKQSIVKKLMGSDEELKHNKQKLKEDEGKLDQSFKENCQLHEQHFDLLHELNKRNEAKDQLMKDAMDKNEQIHDTLHRIQLSYKENFEIITNHFFEHNELHVNQGTLEDFMILPNKVPEDFRLVDEQLKRFEFDFNQLRRGLKENVDVTAKTRELTRALEKLRLSITSCCGKMQFEVNEQNIKRNKESLQAINKVVTSLKANLDAICKKFHAVEENRKRCFEESLKIVNETISEFCQNALNGRVVASLEATNVSAPYLGDVMYFWRTIENPENRITEYSQNYASSLALLLGVFKLQGQRFVILERTSQYISFELDNFFKEQTSAQIISLTSRISDNNAHYFVRPTLKSFAFKQAK